MAGATNTPQKENVKITSAGTNKPVETNNGFATESQLIPNPLHYYSSYTYNLSLSVLDRESFNNATYKLTGPKGPFLAYSANRDPNNRIETVYGKFDFFIEDLKINHLTGFQSTTGNTNAIGFSFKIIEPYSMGLFFIALQQEALAKNYKNYLEAPLLLTLEFKGHLSGNPQFDVQNVTWPNLTRHYPLRLRLIDMRVSPRGCEYDINAYPVNEYAFEQAKIKLQTPASIYGETVEKILKTEAENSFEVYLNKKQKDQVKEAKTKAVADEYVIEFPDVANGVPNPIKSSSLGFNLYTGGTTPYAKDNFVFENGVYKRGNISIRPDKNEFTFAQGTDVVSVINQVIFMSEYGRNSLKTVSADGFVNWWRIEVELKFLSSTENDKQTGTGPKKFIYRVVPYRVSSSYFLPPSEKLKGAELDKKLVVKEYNYIYSGENIDVLDFDINFKTGFYTAINADGGANTKDKILQKKGSSVINPNDVQGTQSASGQNDSGPNEFVNRVEASIIKDPSIGGGAKLDDSASIAVKQFHDALTSGTDMINAELTILGDPYYLSDSGIGNHHAKSSTNLYVNAEGAMNWDKTEIHILINFKTPVDIDLNTGLYNFGKLHTSPQFSGLYRVLSGESTFSGGKFIQKLKVIRLKNQAAKYGSGNLAVTTEEATVTPLINGVLGSQEAKGLLDKLGSAVSVVNQITGVANQINNAVSQVSNTVNQVVQSGATTVNSIKKIIGG